MARRMLDAARLDDAALAEVRRQPGFAVYLPRAVELWRAQIGDPEMVAQSLRDLGRFVSAVWALYLDATPGGLTLTRLSLLLETTGVSAPGRARAMMTFLRFVNYIEPAGGDGRTKLFRPTERLKAALRERYRREFEAFDGIDAEIAACAARLDEPAFFDAIAVAAGELALAGMLVRRRGPQTLDAISHHFGGMVLLGELISIAATPDAPYPPVGPVSFSMAGVAKRCGISRAQARRVLKSGAAQGFFQLSRDGEITLTALLAEHVEVLVGCTLMMFQWVAREATSRARDAAGQNAR